MFDGYVQVMIVMNLHQMYQHVNMELHHLVKDIYNIINLI